MRHVRSCRVDGTLHAANSRSSHLPDQLPGHQEASPSTATLEPNAAVAHVALEVLDDLPSRSVMELDISSSHQKGEVPASNNSHAALSSPISSSTQSECCEGTYTPRSDEHQKAGLLGSTGIPSVNASSDSLPGPYVPCEVRNAVSSSSCLEDGEESLDARDPLTKHQNRYGYGGGMGLAQVDTQFDDLAAARYEVDEHSLEIPS